MVSIRKIANSPAMRMIVGLAAFAAALVGEYDTIVSDVAHLRFTGNHGVMLLALWHTLQSSIQLIAQFEPDGV